MCSYADEYDELICRTTTRNWSKTDAPCYTEVHHITPRCMGGCNSRDNLVVLTAQEHYHAHRLLALLYPHNKGLQQAWWLMCICPNTGKYVSDDDYSIAKARISELVKTRAGFGRNMTDEGRRRQKNSTSKAAKKTCIGHKHMTDEQKRNNRLALSNAAKNQSDLNRLNSSIRMKNQTPEHKANIIAATKRKTKCPHCGGMFNAPLMKRWHGDRCKQNKVVV